MVLSIIKHCKHIRPLLNNGTTSSFCLRDMRYAAGPRFENKSNIFDGELSQEINDEPDSDMQGVKISKQMKSYIKQTRDYEKFMKKEIAEYEIGLRHLANIMGVDVQTIKREGTKKYIEYLFPSGLYDKKARPILEHPTVLFPMKKEVEFNIVGRPHHAFFYTMKPNYYKFLHDARQVFESLENLKQKTPVPATSLQVKTNPESRVSKKEPLDREKLLTLFDEKLSDSEYEYFVSTIKRILSHPLSDKAADFLDPYIHDCKEDEEKIPVHPTTKDVRGRTYVKIENCRRKSSRATVTVYQNGDGSITVNGQNLLYFKEVHFRQQIAFPLIFTGMANKVDIVAAAEGGGPCGQSGAIRWGISQALLSFVDDKMKERMRLAGLLTRDWRRRERKKIGKEGARRAFTWKKR